MTHRTLIECFREITQQQPDRKAIVHQDRSITYAELLSRAESVAAFLLNNKHVIHEEPIGVHGSRSINSIIGMLGAMMAGGAYVPIPSDLPHNRKLEIIKEGNIQVSLDDGSGSLIEIGKNKQISIETICSGKQPSAKFPSLSAEQLAYVIYTSGSSGKPKGVMIEHRNVVALLDAFEKVAPHPESLVGTALVSIGFDVSVWEIFTILCFGGTLHIIDHPQMLTKLASYFVEQDISSAYLPPMILDDFLDKLKNQRSQIALRRLLVGVEPIPQKTLQKYLDAIPGLSLVNAYGPTETTICATFYPFGKAIEDEQRTPIGWAADGYQVHIVNENLEPVENGDEGEILICGAGVGRGYYHDTELSALKFIQDPFSKKPNRCFRSGDFGRRLTDGSIEFIGRHDQQIKVDGFRVECGEIESVLNKHKNIQRVLVVTREKPEGGIRINAYYTTRDGNNISQSEIRKIISRQLPYYMQPHGLIHLKEFPKTANGKIDRRRLPEAQADSSQYEELPLTDLESKLMNIVQQVLGEKIANKYTSFFEAGGNSLQAAKIILLIEEQLAILLSFQNFYEHASVVDLTKFIEGKEVVHETSSKVQIPSNHPDGRFPLSYSQDRLWFMAQSEPDNPGAHSSFILRLTGKLDIDCLQKSLQALVAGNNILRTVFKSEDGIPYQEILPEYDFPFSQVDLSGEADPQSELRIRATDLNQETFDISFVPPFKITLFKLDKKRYALVVIIHHIITDGWSIELFRQELMQLYEKIFSGEPIQVEPETLHYADYAKWQKSEAFQARIQPQLNYWKKKLTENQQIAQLPNDKSRPSLRTYSADTVWLKINGDLLGYLDKYCAKENATQFSVLLSAFCLLLKRYINQDIIQIGSFFANRPLREFMNIMGPFVNGVVLKNDLSGDLDFNSLVTRVKELIIEAQQNQEVPIEKVIDAIHASRDPGQRTLFGIVFNYVNVPRIEQSDSGLEIDYQEFDSGTVIYDLNVEFSWIDEGILFAFEYNTDIYSRATIERFVGHFRKLLEQALEHPELPVEKHQILTNEEIEQIESWNGSATPFPLVKALPSLFEDQVEKTPDNLAVKQADEEISYQELDQRANKLANFLLQRGLKVEEFVGVSLPRSIDWIVALLAVMKAGGVYLPLDPSYPRENLDYILRDAQPAFLITSEDHKGDLTFQPEKVFILNELEKQLQAQPITKPDIEIKADNLAYCIYTSGSTGQPKGVLVEHRSIVNYTCAAISNWEIQSNDRMLQFASPNFDTSLEEIFPMLCSGACLALRTDEIVASLQRFLASCKEWNLTILDLPTAFWHELVLYLEKNKPKLPDSLRLIIIGGERVSPAHLGTWHTLGFDTIRLENTYGLTECTCVVTSGELLPQERSMYAHREVTIGRAIDNVNLYVLDESMAQVPVGVSGELYIGGACLARGYLNLPDLTAERFIPNPFGNGSTGLLYKTGDLTQWRKDGTLEYLGRSDDQIKVRGFRIEPGQIESVLMQLSEIADAVVIKRSDLTGTDQLLVYLRPEKDASVDVSTIKEWIADKLPKYMLPAFYQIMEEFPLSPNGKIDKRALPDPDWEQRSVKQEHRESLSAEEKKMLTIWEEALGRKGIGVEDNFFDIGGHSLLAARMMTEVEKEFGVPIPLVELLENPTVRDLSAVIANKGWKPSWNSVVNMKNSGQLTPLFLVHAIGGDILSYRRLVNYLKDLNRPLYGIRAQGLGGSAEPLESVEKMAAFYLEEIKEIQPQGPYLLGGYSLGGTVAYEMAQQLNGAGEKAAFLAMFDTVVLDNLPPALRPSKLAMGLDQLCRMGFIIRKFIGLSIPKKREYFAKIINVVKGFLTSIAKREKYINPRKKAENKRWQRKPPAFQRVEEINRKALASYIAHPYAGRIAFFKARQREWSEMVNPEPLWRKLTANKLDVYPCEGNHNTILVEPNVRSLSAGLKNALDQLEEEGI